MDKQVWLKEAYYGKGPGALRGPAALHAQARAEKRYDITLKDCKKL